MEIPKLDKEWTVCSPKAVVDKIIDQKNYIMVLIVHPERAINPEKDLPFLIRYFRYTYDHFNIIELNYANKNDRRIADKLYREYCQSQ